MWDGFWLLSNGKIWRGLPQDVKTVIAKHFNTQAVAQRADMARRAGTTEQDLKSRGLDIQDVDTKAFQAKLQSAGFYKEWKGKFGDDAWALLEKHTGPIA